MALPLWLAAVILLYIALAVELLDRALQPSCRVCVHRDICPGRRAGVHCYSKIDDELRIAMPSDPFFTA